jgi:transposase
MLELTMEVSKAKQIMWLLGKGMEPRDVARKVGAHISYVGTVRRRYASGGLAETDVRYNEANIEKIRAGNRERVARWRKANPERVKEIRRRNGNRKKVTT